MPPTLVGTNAAERLALVRAVIDTACAQARRPVGAVELIAISKTQGVAAAQAMIDAGQRHFGENRVQETQAKWSALRAKNPGVTLHHVGQLQSNKADAAVQLFDVIHGLDRPSLVTALARAMDNTGRRLPCFIQVDLAGEPQKGGVSRAELPSLLAQARLAQIDVIGLMAVPPVGLEPAPWFALLGKLGDDHGLAGLSMGMSADFATAIKIGATHVRVGTALFGSRPATAP